MSTNPTLAGGTETAAATLVEGLAAGGVSIAFGLDDPRAFFAALRRSSSVRPVVVHDERCGGFMADAYSRVTGQPVVCCGISGPGAVNLAPALLEARSSCVPLIAVIGEFLPPIPGRHAFQQSEHASFLGKGLCKAIIEVRKAADLSDAGRRAARIATSGRPAPVLLLISDALLWSQLAGERAHPRAAPEPHARLAADPLLVTDAARRLRNAARPVLVAGAGVHAASAHDPLGELARRYGIPVATSMSGKGAISEDDPLALGVTGAYTSGANSRGELALRLLRDADLILVVGSDLDALTTVEWSWPSQDAQLIRIDVDPDELSAFPATINLCGDARIVLDQLLDLAPAEVPGTRHEWLARLHAQRLRIDEHVDAWDRSERAEGVVWPGALMQEIAGRLTGEDWVVADASYSSAWSLDRIVQQRVGRQVLAPRGVGTLGWGVPAAMGVQLANPDARVTAVVGDGALFYALPDMETAARWELGITVVMLRNGVYGSQRQSNLLVQKQDYEDLHFGGRLDHCALAKSLGWESATVSTRAGFAEAYRHALSSPEPWLISVAVDPDARPPLTKFDER